MRCVFIVAATLFSACGPPSAGPEAQRLLDVYAPSLQIGSRLTADARQRYALVVSAYMGYVDERWEGPDGVRKLVVRVDRDTERETEVSPYANVSSVSVDAPTPAITARVDARIRAVMGVPEVACYMDGNGRRVEVRFWPGANGRGIQMLVFHEHMPTTNIHSETYVQGSATVEFGGQHISPQHVDLRPCS